MFSQLADQDYSLLSKYVTFSIWCYSYKFVVYNVIISQCIAIIITILPLIKLNLYSFGIIGLTGIQKLMYVVKIDSPSDGFATYYMVLNVVCLLYTSRCV